MTLDSDTSSGAGRGRGAAAGVILLASAVLLFTNLGHYALWDDESLGALMAGSVWRTGDTSAFVGHNVFGYEGGLLLRGWKDRFQPPLQIYLMAPFVGLMGNTALAARLPMAVCGLGVIGVTLAWLRRSGAGVGAWWLWGAAVVTNASLLLYLRQGRYFAVATLLTVGVAYLYAFWPHRKSRTAVWISALLVSLMFANYVNYAAMVACLVVDYLVWGRGEVKLRTSDWALLILPQVLGAVWIAVVRNPLGAGMAAKHHGSNTLWERVVMTWWQFRDFNACEMGIGAILILAAVGAFALPGRAFGEGESGIALRRWMRRACAALAVYVVVIGFTSPAKLTAMPVAEVRYLAPAIPLALAIEVMVLVWAGRRWGTAASWVLAALLFTTNLPNRAMPMAERARAALPMRSTPVAFWREVFDPPGDPYSAALRWMRGNVSEGQTVWVVPTNMAYPLMYHDPRPVYVWQFTRLGEEDVRRVGERQVFGSLPPPDYLVVFEPGLRPSVDAIVGELARRGYAYETAVLIDQYGKDEYRPELMWRRFDRRSGFDPEVHGIKVLRLRSDTPQPATRAGEAP